MSSVDQRTLRFKVQNITSLPTIPANVKRLLSLMEKPKITLDEFSRFVANDPALTVKVLKMVNSAFYGFPGRISSVSHAIMLLGLNVLKGLLLGVSVCEMMEKSMVGLWEHSLRCAVAARSIALRKGMKKPDEVSVAALLHDIGKVILILEFSEVYAEALRDAEDKEIIITEAELLHFAEPHAGVGRLLFERWNFPANLVEIVAFHHKPQLAKLAPLETAIVHFSDILVRARGLGFAGDSFIPAVHPASFERLQLTEKDLEEILSELEASAEIATP